MLECRAQSSFELLLHLNSEHDPELSLREIARIEHDICRQYPYRCIDKGTEQRDDFDDKRVVCGLTEDRIEGRLKEHEAGKMPFPPRRPKNPMIKDRVFVQDDQLLNTNNIIAHSKHYHDSGTLPSLTPAVSASSVARELLGMQGSAPSS